MKVGNWDVRALTCGNFALDGGAMFGIVPRKLWSAAYPHVDDQNRVRLTARAFLLRLEGQATVVVDSGYGSKLDEKQRKIFGIEGDGDRLLGELEETRIDPDQVTHFIYTHLHFDHAGGSTARSSSRRAEGEWHSTAQPVFRRARHYLQRDHLEWANNPTDKDRASFIPENWQPARDHALLELLDGGGELLPGLELRLVHGHTRGMQMVILHGAVDTESSATGIAFFIDLVPTSAHLPLHYVAAYDNHPLTVIEEKRKFLAEAFEQKWLVAFGHDYSVEAALIKPGKRGFEIDHVVSIV